LSLSITHESRSIYQLTHSKLTGKSAVGSFGFVLGLTFQQRSVKEITRVDSLWCSISLAEDRKVILPRVDCAEGPFRALDEYQKDERKYFEFVLTGRQLEGIEVERGDGDLLLQVGLRSTTSIATDEPKQSLSDEQIRIPREEWLNALHACGFRKTILFELPVADMDDHADQLVSRAQHLIDTGYYKDAVMQCRHIIEHVEAVRGDAKLAQQANKHSQDSETRKNMGIEARMLSMREHVKNICQLGGHGPEQFTRSQARSVLAMTLALLSEPTVGLSQSYNAELVESE
jgi:hypothetical protein